MEGLTRVEVAHYHREVDTTADSWSVVKELDAGFGGGIGFYEDEVYVHEIEDGYHG